VLRRLELGRIRYATLFARHACANGSLRYRPGAGRPVASVTLVTGAAGGWLGGVLSDRLWRVRALKWAVGWFAAMSAASAVVTDLFLVDCCQGAAGLRLPCGMGGRCRAGGGDHRSTPSGQGTWGRAKRLGDRLGSRGPGIRRNFFSGAGRNRMAHTLRGRRCAGTTRPSSAEIAGRAESSVGAATRSTVRDHARHLLPRHRHGNAGGGLLGLGAHGGYYGLFTWLPTYLRSERGLSVIATSAYLGIIIVAFGLGCTVSGQLLDRLGRRTTVALHAALYGAHGYLPARTHLRARHAVVGIPAGILCFRNPGGHGDSFHRAITSGHARSGRRVLLQRREGGVGNISLSHRAAGDGRTSARGDRSGRDCRVFAGTRRACAAARDAAIHERAARRSCGRRISRCVDANFAGHVVPSCCLPLGEAGKRGQRLPVRGSRP
jgi:hypothetical protein